MPNCLCRGEEFGWNLMDGRGVVIYGVGVLGAWERCADTFVLYDLGLLGVLRLEGYI